MLETKGQTNSKKAALVLKDRTPSEEISWLKSCPQYDIHTHGH